jgi:hypothetical protein
MPADEFVR